MSSRAGPRVTGTDGSDFLHREKVANHYKISSTNKSRLRLVSVMHIALWLLLLFRMATPLCVLFGIRPPSFLQRLKLPKAESWEYGWLLSIMPTGFSFLAVKRNNLFLIQQYLLGTLIFGVFPVAWALVTLFDDLLEYVDTKAAVHVFLGFPVVVIWYMFLVVCLQVHGFGLYFGWQLYSAWKTKGNRQKTK